MWIDRLTASRTTRAVELAAAFAEERHRVLAENVANINTPDYHTQRLEPERFQASLRQALESARGNRSEALNLRGNAQFTTGPDGLVQADPDIEPAENLLFHDGTNARLERLLSDAAQNQMFHTLALNLLKGRHTRLMQAIRGRL